MQKDLKIGLVLGLVLAALTAVWLSTRPGLSIKARMRHSRDAEPMEDTATDEQPRFITDLPNAASTEAAFVIKKEHNDIPDFTIYRKPEKTKPPKIHIVRRGETLSNISYIYYGSANKWQKIYNANRKAIKDPHKLRPGTRLFIPE
jgi:nucleoid-associated protein YgaU